VDLLPQLPERFDKNDVQRALGFTPSRSTLFRALEELQMEGVIAVETAGSGRTPSKFRKVYTQEEAPVEAQL
jgi:DNA-binding PadR family transcriptional regulator